jgi:hypothetical protein
VRRIERKGDRTTFDCLTLIPPQGYGGEGEIRTPETLASLPVFKTGAFNRSATSPCACNQRTGFYQAAFAFPCVIMRVGTVPERDPRAPR